MKTESRIWFDWQVYDYSDKTTIRMRIPALWASRGVFFTGIDRLWPGPVRARFEQFAGGLKKLK